MKFFSFGRKKEETDAKIDKIDLDTAVPEAILSVGGLYDQQESFTEEARKWAGMLGGEALPLFRNYFFGSTLQKPDSLAGKYEGLGDWLHIQQDAIFEIIYHYKEKAIPMLYDVAFGVYDWTQYKAVRVLTRLAAEGIQTDRIVEDIVSHVDDFRYEAQMPTFYYLSSLKGNEKVASLLERHFLENLEYDPIDAFDLFASLYRCSPDTARKHEDFLKVLARGEGLEGRSPLLDGAIGTTDEQGHQEYHWPDGEPVEEHHQIRAASFYYQLNPEDEEINRLLDRWEKQHPEDQVREYIRELRERI
ncbi:transcriptional regulator [Paenibacillus sp. CAA11]|uniref:transcriptional regulator n=1 Tax=Paenibacillus sp. CAA11 TaxID=1532905 RepID=UPI000D37A93E|nr:transcriptional regulator [Paenibacillus sp. CAA11]AWB43492.1 transcriptional regulator [Paenibacillus sp. CAA11]